MHSFGVVGPVLGPLHVGKYPSTELYLTQLYAFLNVHPENIPGRNLKRKANLSVLGPQSKDSLSFACEQ